MSWQAHLVSCYALSVVILKPIDFTALSGKAVFFLRALFDLSLIHI